MHNITDLKLDFRLFLIYVWKMLDLPTPTPVQLDMAHYLQHGPRRLGIKAFRGVGKSWITSAFVCWLLLNNRELKVLVVSASKERADAFSIFTKRLLVELPILQHLQPDKGKGDRDSSISFDVRGCRPAHAPSCKSVGITGQIAGSRADYIVADDVEVPNNSETATQREKLLNRFAELGGAVLTPEAKAGTLGGVAVLGTPQVEDTLYLQLAERGYTFRVWPAEVPDDVGQYSGSLAPMILAMGEPGTPTDPLRFDRGELAERRLEYGRAGYALQYQLDTTLADADRHPLKLRDCIVFPTAPDVFPETITWAGSDEHVIEALPLVGLPGDRFQKPAFVSEQWSPYSGSVMYIDPSGRGRDQTGYAVVKYIHGYLVVRRWGGLEGGYGDKTLARLATIAKEEKVNEIMVEDNFGDGMFRELFSPVLRRIYDGGCKLEGEHVIGQKEVRIIDSVEPVLATHKLVLDLEVVKAQCRDKTKLGDPEAAQKTGVYQLSRITAERGCLKFDDQLDALAGAVRYWTERMAADVKVEVDERKRERLEAMVDKFLEDFDQPGQPKTWTGIEAP